MSEDWYVFQNDKQYGPLSKSAIASMLAAGRITASAMLWKEGMTEWIPVTSVIPPKIDPATPGAAEPRQDQEARAREATVKSNPWKAARAFIVEAATIAEPSSAPAVPKKQRIPEYVGIESTAFILKILAAIDVVAGVIALLTIFAARDPFMALISVASALACITSACLLVLFACVAEAVRDIAQNSWEMAHEE